MQQQIHKLKFKTTQKRVKQKSTISREIEQLIIQGFNFHQNNKLIEAKNIYEQVLYQEPHNFSALQLLGLLYAQLNLHHDALVFLNKAIQVNPKFVPCYINRGISLQTLGKSEEALASYEKAILLDQNSAEAFSNRAITLKELGRLNEALESCNQAIRINSNYADAHNNRGIILKELNQFDEALVSFYQAIKLNSGYADAYLNLGNTLIEFERFSEALESYEHAIKIRPDYAEIYYSIGNLYKDLRKFTEALVGYDQAIQLRPNYAEAYLNRGFTLSEVKQYDDALISYDQAIKIKPNYAAAYLNKGYLFKELKKFDKSLECYKKAIQIDPFYSKAYINRGLVLVELGRLNEALDCFNQIISFEPDSSDAFYNLGVVLNEKGDFLAAIESYQKAVLFNSNADIARSNILFTMSYSGICEPANYLENALQWNAGRLTADQQLTVCNRVLKNNMLRGRRLRVGYVSGDYFNHAVSYFIEQLFENHDRGRIELFAYYSNKFEDVITKRLKLLVDRWVPIHDLSYDEARDHIEGDGIDILIDLSGHTGHNKLGIFALRAAPIQAHYLGYFATTGLSEMDYWIGDEILTPPKSDIHFREEVWRLSRTWVSYGGRSEAPMSNWKPAQDGTIWLGSFNNLGKLAPATMALWAKVLHAIPEARLLLKTKKLGNEGNRQRLLESMAAHGIGPERIELQDGSITPDWAQHMAYYDRLDIALDPVGAVAGGTTTCDALWMGVPVITLAKEDDFPASRMSASMLHALGHPEWNACSESEYIDKVVALARDVEKRKALRFNQRSKMAQSPLCDAKGLATALEDAYESMFNKWYQKKQLTQEANPGLEVSK